MSEGEATDRIHGMPHPREATQLIGQAAAEETLRRALAAGRMPHAWLFSGPPGVGKATLAYRLARFVLAFPDAELQATRLRDLSVDPEDQAAKLVAQGAHPDLRVLRRGFNEAGKPRAEIAVKDARETMRAFSASAGRGGWRVVIVDTADDLNAESANALLKTIEEPPPRSLVLLLADAPAALLPTIRSRCRRLALPALTEGEVLKVMIGLGLEHDHHTLTRSAGVADGSLRRAAEVLDPGALDVIERLRAALEGAAGGNTPGALAIAEATANAKRPGIVDVFTQEAQRWLEHRLRSGERGPLSLCSRLEPHRPRRGGAPCLQPRNARLRPRYVDRVASRERGRPRIQLRAHLYADVLYNDRDRLFQMERPTWATPTRSWLPTRSRVGSDWMATTCDFRSGLTSTGRRSRPRHANRA